MRLLAGMRSSSVVKQTQHQTSKTWFRSMACAFFQWEPERQLSPGSACFALLALCHSTMCGTRPGKNGAKRKKKEKKPQPLKKRNNHTKISEVLNSNVYPKGNKDQSWGHWSALCQGNYTLYSCGFGAVQISMLWTRAQRDNLCQPPLPTRLQGVGHSNLQSPPAASVLTNALQVLLLHHQASNTPSVSENCRIV